MCNLSHSSQFSIFIIRSFLYYYPTYSLSIHYHSYFFLSELIINFLSFDPPTIGETLRQRYYSLRLIKVPCSKSYSGTLIYRRNLTFLISKIYSYNSLTSCSITTVSSVGPILFPDYSSLSNGQSTHTQKKFIYIFLTDFTVTNPYLFPFKISTQSFRTS